MLIHNSNKRILHSSEDVFAQKLIIVNPNANIILINKSEALGGTYISDPDNPHPFCPSLFAQPKKTHPPHPVYQEIGKYYQLSKNSKENDDLLLISEEC